MEARVDNRGGVYVVSLAGQMDFEGADSLKSQCLRLFAEKNVVFNLRELMFVGSSGITPFLELLAELQRRNGQRFKICNVNSDFMRLFESSAVDGIEIYKDIGDAVQSYRGVAEVQALTRLRPFGLKLNIED